MRLRQWAELNGEDIPQQTENTNMKNEYVRKNGAGQTLLPESHTALYGDRFPPELSRSRSSSMDADDGDEIAPRPSTFIVESLKSLSLANPSSVPARESFSSESMEVSTLPRTTPEEQSAITTFDFPLPTSRPYSPKTLQSLLMRYEPPSPFSKWDTPLFTVPSCDAMPPISAIWDALFPPRAAASSRKGGISELKAEVKPHAATVLPHTTGTDALQVMESITADIVTQIMAQTKAQSELATEGGKVAVNLAGTTATFSIPPGTTLNLPVLQRLRRRFTQLQRGGIAHGRGYVKGESAVGEAFVRFLNTELGS
jgi:tRNA uridine 5-carbamoylmethylation protein Kti12